MGCFETNATEGGKAATVHTKKLVVWDVGSCDQGKSYFYYTPTSGSFRPMLPEIGPAVRTYHAAIFQNYNDYGTWVGRCGDTPIGGVNEFTWQVANTDRSGSCPKEELQKEAASKKEASTKKVKKKKKQSEAEMPDPGDL